MSKKPAPLTPSELAEVEASRREARIRVLASLEAMTDEEDARLTAAAESDPDNPPLTEEFWKRARPAHEKHPDWVRKSLERRRGRPKLESPKRQVTLRLDADVLDHFKAGGSGWQTEINGVLREVVEKQRSRRKRAKSKRPYVGKRLHVPIRSVQLAVAASAFLHVAEHLD